MTLGILFVIGVVGLTVALLLYLTFTRLLYVATPNQALIFSGSTRESGEKVIGYEFVRGGRRFRRPLLERVDTLDLSMFTVHVNVTGAFSKGGIPLTIQGVANVKLPGEEPLLTNAVERFLGRTREEVYTIAKETLEGNLRGVLASLTPEEVNEDKVRFAHMLVEEAEHDMSRMGLVLDTLKIQNVTDESGYLDAIGRVASAAVRRDAVIAEANAKADAAEQKWRNTMNAEVQKLETQISVARAENDRRISEATARRGAVIAEQQAEVQASIAQTQAEVSMQEARIEQVKLQLQADVIQPAEAARQQAEQNAKADAAKIIEQGRATATVLKNLAATYRGSGTSARDVLLMQKLVPMLGRITESMGSVKIDRLTVIGGGGGGGVGGGSLAGQLVSASEQIKAATGIDVPQMIKDRYASPRPPAPAPRSASSAPAAQPAVQVQQPRPITQPPPGGRLPPGVRGG
jgi:flotillin